MTRKIPFALLANPCSLRPRTRPRERPPEPCSKTSALELLLFSMKTRDLSAPKYLEGIRHQSGNDKTPRNEAQCCFGNLHPSDVLTCVSQTRSSAMALRTPRSSTEILGMTHGNLEGSVVSVVCFGLGHLGAAREPAVQISSPKISDCPSALVITHR